MKIKYIEHDMSVEKRLFLGIKQMKKETFLELQDSEKVGYIWFVRCDEPVHFEIYLGTKKYGETNEENLNSGLTQEIIDRINADNEIMANLASETQNRLDADTELSNRIDNKQDKLIAGSGITISGDTISAVIPESLMVHKRLIVDDISEFLYDIKPKTLESYGFTTDDVNRFLDDSLTVEVVVHPIQVFLKLILPGLYKVYDTLLPDALKRLLSNCHKLKFDTQTSEVFPVQKLSEIVYTTGSIENLLNNWEPVPVEATARTTNVGTVFGYGGMEYEGRIYIGSFVYSLLYLEYFNFEPMRFWIINDFKLDDSSVKTLVTVTDNQLGLPCFNFGLTSQSGKNDYVYLMFEEILKNVPKDNNYSSTSALMELLKYFNDNFPVEMQSYYEYEGFSDYNNFKAVYEQIANEVGNPSGSEDIFIGTRMASAFLTVMRDGNPSQEELDAVYQEGYNLGYNDDSYDDTKNPYTSPSQRYDSWYNGYYQGYQDGHK